MKHPVLSVFLLLCAAAPFAMGQSTTRVCVVSLRDAESDRYALTRDVTALASSLSQQKVHEGASIVGIALAVDSNKQLPAQLQANSCRYLVKLWRYSDRAVDAHTSPLPNYQGASGMPQVQNEDVYQPVAARTGRTSLTYELRRAGENRVLARRTAPIAYPPGKSGPTRVLTVSFPQLASEIASRIPSE